MPVPEVLQVGAVEFAYYNTSAGCQVKIDVVYSGCQYVYLFTVRAKVAVGAADFFFCDIQHHHTKSCSQVSCVVKGINMVDLLLTGQVLPENSADSVKGIALQ